MPLPPDFPLTAPYRLTQVTQSPLLMAGLFGGQILLALLIQCAGILNWSRIWKIANIAHLAMVLLFYTLGSWGNSDTTRFSHYMEWDTTHAPPELLWRLLRPLILLLPYRMAFVHGLVATGFALAMVLLAVAWQSRAWAGWWVLLVCCSPLLRGFLQNAHSRQALGTLLMLPLFLQSARLLWIPGRWIGLGVLLSAITHNTFAWNLPISISPVVLRLLEPRTWRLHLSKLGRIDGRWLRTNGLILLSAAVVLGLLALVAPTALRRFGDYITDDYYNSYTLRSVVGRLQRGLGLSLLAAMVYRRLDPRRLFLCPITQLLVMLAMLYVGIQVSIIHSWIPQVTSRLSDGVGFFMLIAYLAWLHRYQAQWFVFIPLYITLQYWLEGRILRSALFECGRNDEFLCIPDRWPWQVHY